MSPGSEPSAVLATMRALESVYEAHIEGELITSLTLLCSGRGMGLRRHAAITRQPAKCLSRLRSLEEPAPGALKPAEHGLARATKHARATILTVDFPDCEPCQGVLQSACQHRERVLDVTVDVLREDLTPRLGRPHVTSSAMKVCPECERLVSQLVR